MEIWKEVTGYNGLYEVSSRGNVRSNHKSPRLLKMCKNKGGYSVVRLYDTSGKKETIYVHILVAQHFIGESLCPHCGTRMDVNHKNNNKDDNSVDNLEYTTRAVNVRHGHKFLSKTKGWQYNKL